MNNTKIRKVAFLTTMVAVLLVTPHTTFATGFSFTQVSSYNDGKAFTYPSNTTADVSLLQVTDVTSPLFFWGWLTDPLAKCNVYVAYANLPSTADTYCVYDAYLNYGGFGSSFYGSGGGSTNTTLNIPVSSLAVYQNKITPTTLPAILTVLNNYSTAVFLYNVAVMMGTTPLPPIPMDPGFRDVCSYENKDGGVLYTSEHDVATDPNTACNVYRSPGTPSAPPLATLSATPATVAAGLSSALTYTCDASATSASIDNGVGTVTRPTGTVGVTPGSTTTYTLTCTNANGSGTAQATVSVTSALPDLTAGSITPTTASAGALTTLSTNTTNSGPTAAGAFPTLFQVQETGAVVPSSYNNGLAQGASAPATASYTFPSAGTYNVRACANNNASWINIISESNYANNCGPWTPITVTGVTPAPTCTFSANPTASVPSTLTWSSTDATSCTGGGFSTGRFSPISGSASVSTVGSYTLTCTGAGGSCTQSLSVGASCSGSPTGTVTAKPNRVRTGVPTSVTFSLPNAQNVQTSCTLSGPGMPTQTYAANACTVSGTYTASLTLSTQSVYTLTCDGVKASSTIVNVLPNFTEF
jgi:CARDB